MQKRLSCGINSISNASTAAIAEIEKLGGHVEVKTAENGDVYSEVVLSGSPYKPEWTGGAQGVIHLKQLPNLRNLRIQELDEFTDEAMAHLKDIKSLKSLILIQSQVTDDGLVNLKNLTNLELLALWRNDQFTDKALDHLRGLNNLKILRFDDAQITDDGLKKLKQFGLLTGLEFLVLTRTQITDAGLLHLKGLAQLQELSLTGTGITDTGLSYLKEHKKLQTLFLSHTKITHDGYMNLQRDLPHVQITWEKPRPLKVGDRAPEITVEKLLQAPEDTVANWESLKGKVVVLEFWATWCPPCIRAIPHMNKLANKFEDEQIQFIAVTSEKVEQFLDKRQIGGWIGIDTDRSMAASYGVTGIPDTIVVDKNGTIHAITHPMSLTEQSLNRLLIK
jgi:thiol-disulfide isomerase/thioredoxin